MNSSLTLNQTIDFKKKYLDTVAIWQMDLLYFFVLVPMGTFGTLFNLFSLKIFIQKQFRNIPLFQYMICYTTNSSIVTFSLTFYFLYCTFYLYDLSTSYFARIFKCQITVSYVTAFFFFYSNCLDVLINIERTLNFSTRYTKFKAISPFLNGTIVFVICLIINIPTNLAYDIVDTEEFQLNFRICKITQFSRTIYGKILLILSYLTQGPLVLFLVILTNVTSVISFKRFLKRKLTLLVQNKTK